MRYLTILLLFLSAGLSAQVTQDSLLQQLRAVVVVQSSSNVDSNEYNIVVTTFQDPTSLYDIMEVEAGDWIWTLSSIAGQSCNRYEIQSINNTGVGEYTLNVLNPDQTGVNGLPQVGVGNPIFRHSPNRDYPLFIASQPTLSGYINPDIQTCVTTHLILAIDQDISSGGSGNTSSLTDNSDGTYTHDDGTGNTVVIDTRANSNPVEDAGDIYVGDNVEDVLQEIPKLNCVTINQSAHGLDTLDMVTHVNGAYALAMTDTAIHLPIGLVTDVFTVNQFRMCFEGKIKHQHGKVNDKDYFLQDDGSVDTIPASIPVYAYRTIGANEVIFDVSEYISNGSIGNGSSPTVITASNGLNDQDGGTDVDVELGGTLDKNTLINGANYRMTWDGLNDFYVINLQDEARLETDTLANRKASLIIDSGNNWMRNYQFSSDWLASVETNQSGQIILQTSSVDGLTIHYKITIGPSYFQIEGLPDYANNAAADADGALPAGSIYTVTAEDRTLRIKP